MTGKLGAAIVAFGFAIIGSVAEPQAADFEPHKVGTVFRDAIEVGNDVTVPLPDGEWLLVANTVRTSGAGVRDGGQRFYAPVLADVKGKMIRRFIVIANSVEKPQRVGFADGYVFNSTCRNPTHHFNKEFVNLDGSYQDCWWIRNAGANLTAQAREEYYASWNYFTQNKMQIPLRSMQVTFHFANPKGKYLDVSVYHNPEAAGFKNTTWNRDEIRLDEPKQKYVGQLTEWGTSWHDRLKDGFEGKLNGGSRIVKEPQPAVASATAPAAATPKAEKNSTVANKAPAADKKVPAIEKSDFDPSRYRKVAPVAALQGAAFLSTNYKKIVADYADKAGAKALAMAEGGKWLSFSSKAAGQEREAIEAVLDRCQSNSKLRCYVIAIGDDLTMSVDSIKSHEFQSVARADTAPGSRR